MTGETQTYYYDGLQLRREDWSNSDHSFIDLVGIIGVTHDTAQTYAVKAINRVQTMRNWLIGYYIIEFEQHGKDRADYGSNLLQTLEEKVNRKGLNITLFKNARRFYVQYPQIAQLFSMQNSPTVSDKWIETKSSTVSDFLADTHKTDSDRFTSPANKIISLLSFSHICELLTVDDPVSRYFYEQECMRCTWSVRELRRQINTNLFARMGMSSNPEKMLSLSKSGELDSNELQIRQPFTFEFLGLKAQEVIDEHDLEDALIAHLQDFMLELGKGFCLDDTLQRQAAHAVNQSLTVRNWLIGCYIVEFEQNGEDRAAYGEKLLKHLEERVNKKGLTERRFREFRRIYQVYPQLAQPIMEYLDIHAATIRQTMSAELELGCIAITATESTNTCCSCLQKQRFVTIY